MKSVKCERTVATECTLGSTEEGECEDFVSLFTYILVSTLCDWENWVPVMGRPGSASFWCQFLALGTDLRWHICRVNCCTIVLFWEVNNSIRMENR